MLFGKEPWQYPWSFVLLTSRYADSIFSAPPACISVPVHLSLGSQAFDGTFRIALAHLILYAMPVISVMPRAKPIWSQISTPRRHLVWGRLVSGLAEGDLPIRRVWSVALSLPSRLYRHELRRDTTSMLVMRGLESLFPPHECRRRVWPRNCVPSHDYNVVTVLVIVDCCYINKRTLKASERNENEENLYRFILALAPAYGAVHASCRALSLILRGKPRSWEFCNLGDYRRGTSWQISQQGIKEQTGEKCPDYLWSWYQRIMLMAKDRQAGVVEILTLFTFNYPWYMLRKNLHRRP